jgi:hypothetical protein
MVWVTFAEDPWTWIRPPAPPPMLPFEAWLGDAGNPAGLVPVEMRF